MESILLRMFRFLVTSATMSAMLLHSILGCCWHHAHSCGHDHAEETCLAEYDGHADAGHSEHACAARHDLTDSDHAVHQHELTAELTATGPVLSAVPAGCDCAVNTCPHAPCRHTCDGGSCAFTPVVEFRTPVPDHAGTGLCGLFAAAHVPPAARRLSLGTADTGPPGLSAACCCRPMTQVWRL